MMPRSRRGFQAQSAAPERVRTHLLFSSQSEHHTLKRKRRTHNKFHQTLHKKDEMVQANPDEMDPSRWTGNQRVLHFGPMAQRDPFFYYYPKGWDVLYPAQFGFFPYRTNKFRGNTPVICVWAFGVFFLLGGGLMTFLGYFLLYEKPFWKWSTIDGQPTFPPIQIAGPLLFGLGVILVLIGAICSISTSQFLNDRLRYHHHRGQAAAVTVYTTHVEQPRGFYERHPYQPLPPPSYPVLENRYAHSSMLNPQAEMKLYPPVMPGYSTLSLHGQSPNAFVASPYNTLRAMSNRYASSVDPPGAFDKARTASVAAAGGGAGSGSRRQSTASVTDQRRAKSLGAPHRGSSSGRRRDRQTSPDAD